ncbi:MAG: calcium/sodium antiporter [Kiritimatiellia bacterium]
MFDINQNVPLWLSLAFIVGGLVALGWSADRFVESAARLARAFGVSPLIVGMVIIGFGTSAPELAVSVLSGLAGQANLSLGNAYGSCTFNMCAILGIAALISPICVKPSVTRYGVPLLLAATGLSYVCVRDMAFERVNGIVLLVAFAVVMPVYCWFDQRQGAEAAQGGAVDEAPPKATVGDFVWLVGGLLALVASSHVLVWGSVDFARDVLGVSPLLIGLTIVAAGTSLPELASAIASARRNEHEFVIGNIVGSNLFNMLGVVGVAGTISPFSGYSDYIVSRDLPMMGAMTVLLCVFGFNFRRHSEPGRITRWEGAVWILLFAVYLVVMVAQETGHWPLWN